jgi:serpin B
MHVVDFALATGRAIAEINRWISSRTHGKIKRLLGPQDVDKLTRVVLVDAAYLHAKWLLPFEQHATSPARFDTPGGTVRVPMMHQTASFSYLRGRGYQALELPYEGHRLAFDVLLPDPGQFPALLRRFSNANPLDLLSGFHRQLVSLSLPKFQLRARFELSDALTALGMPLAFIPGQADLSGIAGRPGDLYVKAVTHEAYLRVDEAGTEAAAATAVVVETTSLPVPGVVFDVNRPFVFLLRDLKTNAILFLGAVSHP